VVEAVPGPAAGDQGSAVELLTAACSGGAITMFHRSSRRWWNPEVLDWW
jgi:hypothetical protein